MAPTDTGFHAQQLVELLAVVSSCQDEASATVAAVERAAQAMEAEFSALVVDRRVVTSVGFRAGSDHDLLLAVAQDRRARLEVPNIGSCATGAAALGVVGDGRLVIARRGDDEFTVGEYNLIRGMARVLGLTLRMLRTLDAERRRQELMQHLYRVQRAISRRVPLQETLSMIVTGTREILGTRADLAGIWLLDADAPGHLLQVCVAGLPDDPGTRLWRMPLAEGGAAGQAVRTDQLVQRTGYVGAGGTLRELTDGRLGRSMAAPVYENGTVAGSLLISGHRGGPDFTVVDQEKLLAFAEHVSLAITDARTVHDMNQAMHDSLTGLASRALFLDRLADELDRADRTGSRTAVLFLDLDRFKQVNDTYGHAAGDVLLVAVAHRLQGVLRDRDVAARFGGDEFAVMLRDVADSATAVEVAGRVIAALGAAYRVPGGRADVSASIGVALGGPALSNADELMRRADVAMYRAKRSGHGRSVVFHASMDADRGTDSMAADVRRTIDHLTHSTSPGALT